VADDDEGRFFFGWLFGVIHFEGYFAWLSFEFVGEIGVGVGGVFLLNWLWVGR